MGQTYPLPITAAMLTPANANVGKPRYDTPADWSQGASGNDVNVATVSTPVVGSDSAATVTPYPIRTQTAKAAAMTPALPVLGDLGKDYGAYAGQAGRNGILAPGNAYPDATAPPVVTGVSPATGPAAGGTAVIVSGYGFTGATSVKFGGTGGTNATSVVVVNSTTITCVSPARSAGAADVVVTTPNGNSAATGGSNDNFVYT